MRNDERAQFEAWAEGGLNIEDRPYVKAWAWEAWQARAAIAQQPAHVVGYVNPAPHAAQPAMPTGQTVTVQIGGAAIAQPAEPALTECADNDSPWLICKPCAAAGKCANASDVPPLVTRLRQERRPTAWTRGMDTDYPTAWEPNLLCHEAAAEIVRLRCLVEAVRGEFRRECDDTDAVLHALGLDPEKCRTDGGGLKLAMLLGALAHRDVMQKREAKTAERERCAAVCDSIARQYKDDSHGHAAERAANAIRLDQP